MNNNVNKVEFKAAKVPLRVCFKLALKNIWKKKFRFLTIILICSISLAFLSFTIELNGDKLRQNVYTMVENGYNFTTIKEYSPLDKEAEKENFYNQFNSTELSVNSYNKIKEQIPELIVHKYEQVAINYAGKDIEISTDFYPGYINTIVEYDKTNTYTLLAGRLPNEDEKEILITDYLVSAFNYFDTFMEEGTYYDYLNQTIDLTIHDDYKIVGVIDTNFENWTSLSGFNNNSIDSSDKVNYSYFNDLIYMNSIIIPSKYFAEEKVNTSSELSFTQQSQNSSEWLINFSNNNNNKNFIPNTLNFQTDGLSICKRYNRWDVQDYGRVPSNDNEIAIPSGWLPLFYNTTIEELTINEFNTKIKNNTITITLTPKDNSKSYYQTYTVVGIVNSESTSLISNTNFNILTNYTIENENILIELPSTTKKAYDLFNKAYECGYIIDVWAYQNDVDSYIIDPFVNLLSKAGLVVFLAFTIGIMWTIITIEIVDSKKEIGILRSIGLSGFKVSLIFIIQALFVSLIAYGISLFLSSYVIEFYNSGITDELGVISLYMYSMTYRTPIYLLLFVIVIAFISTIFPLSKIMSQKIIDVINERE